MKDGAALIAATIALAYLVFRARSELPEEFHYVEQVVANPEVVRGGRLEICGHVACGSIERRRGTDGYRFKIQGLQSQTNVVLEVCYTGPVPDTFGPGKLVVVRGKLGDDGVFDVVEGGIMVRDCGYSRPIYWRSLIRRRREADSPRSGQRRNACAPREPQHGQPLRDRLGAAETLTRQAPGCRARRDGGARSAPSSYFTRVNRPHVFAEWRKAPPTVYPRRR